MNGSPLQSALREMHALFRSRIARFSLLVAVFVLTVSGPFGTFQSFNLGQRLAYWAVMVLGSYIVGQGAAAFFIAWLCRWITDRWPRLIVAALLASLPVTVVVFVVNVVAYRDLLAAPPLTLWLYATLVTVVIVVALSVIGDQMRAAVAAAHPEPGSGSSVATAPTLPKILERVPLPQRGRLLALSVEDHYVDVVTDRGKTLVLMRLADAIGEVGDTPGLRIHRSHWVARDAVVKAHRSDGKVTLELSNGIRLPVSRGFLPAVREAGLG